MSEDIYECGTCRHFALGSERCGPCDGVSLHESINNLTHIEELKEQLTALQSKLSKAEAEVDKMVGDRDMLDAFDKTVDMIMCPVGYGVDMWSVTLPSGEQFYGETVRAAIKKAMQNKG